ncbi:hypothetical protein ACQKWADRAFT_66609 [Trichoderma austrokoningii]
MCYFDTRPWKLPAPFVGLIFRSFVTLLLLANAGAAYERLNIFGIYSVLVFILNSGMIYMILCTIALFCAKRWRNHFFSADVKVYCITFAVLWTLVFVSNLGYIMAGFIICNVPRFQHDAESKYCHFFGNRGNSDWKTTGWPVYYWSSIVVTMIMACWQMISWFFWFNKVRDILRRRNAAMDDE